MAQLNLILAGIILILILWALIYGSVFLVHSPEPVTFGRVFREFAPIGFWGVVAYQLWPKEDRGREDYLY